MITYQETLDFLYSQLPMFQRIGAAAYKADLNNTLALCQMMNHPERDFPAIHIAGTNGKGSSSHMLASIFQEAGYKTALYTSPHLIDFRERIRVNGQMIPKENVVEFVEKYKNQFEAIKPSFFELTFAMALDFFSAQKVDIAIMETGMGGRLDSTNVVLSQLSIITNIGMDHMAFLGDSLPKIAAEKAGIIKPNTPVIIGEYHAETNRVFTEKASSIKAPIYFAPDRFQVIQNEDSFDIYKDNSLWNRIKLPLQGYYQTKNLATVSQAYVMLQEQWKLTEEHFLRGLERVVANTSLMGRWQQVQLNPRVILDTGHNEHGLKLTMQQLKQYEYKKLYFVLGLVNDKEVQKILKLLPSDAHFYLCQARIPRALPIAQLEKSCHELSLNYQSFNSVADAYEAALKDAQADDMIFVGGSTFVVAEVLEML